MANKNQPQLTDVISVLIEQLEEGNKTIEELKLINATINSNMDKITKFKPSLNTDNLKIDLESLRTIIESHKTDTVQIIRKHLELLEKHKNKEIGEKQVQDRALTFKFYLKKQIQLLFILFTLFFFYKSYKINQEVTFKLDRMELMINQKKIIFDE